MGTLHAQCRPGALGVTKGSARTRQSYHTTADRYAVIGSSQQQYLVEILQEPNRASFFESLYPGIQVAPILLERGAEKYYSVDERLSSHRGRDTLVIDTRNYHNRGWIVSRFKLGRIRGTSTGNALHAVERFTQISDDTTGYDNRGSKRLDQTVDHLNIHHIRHGTPEVQAHCHESNWPCPTC